MSFIAIFISVALLLLAVIFWVTIKFFLTRVSGESMLPTFKEGDVLLIRPVLFHSKEQPIENGIYIYTHERQVVKRLTSTLPPSPNSYEYDVWCFFEGDNPDRSYDSRQYGPIRWTQVRFKVIKKLFNYV